MKTANLTGALLDYWTARAEGIPAEQLSIRPVPRTDDTICVREQKVRDEYGFEVTALPYSTDWARGGPLIEKHKLDLGQGHMLPTGRWEKGGYVSRVAPFGAAPAYILEATAFHTVNWMRGDTALQAVCRAVVRAAFGDEVEDLPC